MDTNIISNDDRKSMNNKFFDLVLSSENPERLLSLNIGYNAKLLNDGEVFEVNRIFKIGGKR